jgi:pimeloyl-ACP methyl ester carboxylesterase
VTIAYGEAGTGLPLLLLHGLGSWSWNWRCNIEPLSQHYRVICIDAKGYGFSETSPLPETAGHQIIELVRLIRALSDQPVTIAAESLGALTALAVAEAHPELIQQLILINVPLFPQQLPSWGMRALTIVPLTWVEWVDKSRLLRWFAPLVLQLTRLVRQEVVVDTSTITDAEIEQLTYPYLYRTGTLTQFAADLQLAADEIERYQAGEPNLISMIQSDLARVACPTLILWSDCDRWFPVQDGKRLHQLLPAAQFQIIPNCGHVASSGNPAAVNAAILSFGLHSSALTYQ